jgi:hypothetical protein
MGERLGLPADGSALSIHLPMTIEGEQQACNNRYRYNPRGSDIPVMLALYLLYLSTQFLWWQAVADIIGVTSNNTLRNNSRCPWRQREGSRNVDNIAIRHPLSPLRPCRSVTAVVHGCPRGVAPIRPHTARRDTPVATHGRRNDAIASPASGCAAHPLILFSPPAMASPQLAVRRKCLI